MGLVTPNFFILGAAKSGTTFLHRCLDDHPDICMSSPKEPFFFEAEFDEGLDFYSQKYFAHYRGESVVGESRHRNLYLPFVPDRIADNIVDPRFIVVLRDPVARAFSHWWHCYSRGEDPLSFVDAVKDNLRRIAEGPNFETPQEIADYAATLDRTNGYSPYRTYIDTGYYASQIKRYVERFGRGSIRVILFEDMVSNPSVHYRAALDFLNVELRDLENFSSENQAVSRKQVMLSDALGRIPGARLIPKSFRKAVRNRILSLLPNTCEKIDPDSKAWLADHFRSHNEALLDYLETGQSLSKWET